MRNDYQPYLSELDSLLRGEISAAETYRQALSGIESAREAAPLRSIQQDHGDAIRFLRSEITRNGGEPSSSSGVWGFFARATEGTAKLFGDSAALTALREGERHGLADYEEALREPSLPADCREFIGRTLIPRQRQHIEQLTRMLESR
jgi:uncharacterized protein (TIGR02284 family)